MEGLCFKEDYDRVFDIQTYLTSNFSKENISQGITQNGYLLRLLHKIFSEIKPKKGGDFLDFGTGPSLYTVFSASRCFQNITLAEYAAQNRAELERWRTQDTGAFDWSAVLSIISELEGISSQDIASRTRAAIKHVIPCDVTEEKILLDHSTGPYDFVLSVLCLEASCPTLDVHRKAIQKLCDLVIPGGGLFLSGVLGESFYTVAGHKFFALVVTKDYLKETLEHCGMVIKMFESIGYDYDSHENELSDGKGMYYIHAIKKS